MRARTFAFGRSAQTAAQVEKGLEATPPALELVRVVLQP